MNRSRIGLRGRVTGALAIAGILAAVVLSALTLTLTRQVLLTDSNQVADALTFTNAQTVQRTLAGDLSPGATQAVVDSLNTAEGSRPLISTDAENSFSLDGSFTLEQVPLSLQNTVAEGNAANIVTSIDGEPFIVYGIPLQDFENVVYFEAFPLISVEETLETLQFVLLGGGLVVAGLAALAGRAVAINALSPLTNVSRAAEAIAGGRLDTRLDTEADEDLERFATSFNDMAGALEERVQRDARFASEVSHELRSPLMTLTASAEVLENARDELPERSQQALDLLVSDITRFSTLVEDLLEISRFDVGTASLQADPLLFSEFVMAAVSAASTRDIEIVVDENAESAIILAEKRRLARVVANLLDNAEKYGGGATLVQVSATAHSVMMSVEDEGPGVPIEERFVIFDRFSRGGAGGRRGYDTGVGLGLSLVAEHINLHGGRVWVEDRLDGKEGARFVVELPIDHGMVTEELLDDGPEGEFA